MASQVIEALSSALARLPGLGPRSARRAVLWLINRVLTGKHEIHPENLGK